MTCPTTLPGPFRCPTLDESIAATLALMPQGRVWPARDPGIYARFADWLGSLTGTPALADWPAGYVQTGFFAAVGAVRNYVESRLCDLRMEFWCATHKESHAEWLAEYGLPDDCDPFPDLCAKVAAQGGAQCSYFQEVTARLGWHVDCYDWTGCRGARVGRARAGRARTGTPRPNVLLIVVHTPSSPAFNGGAQTQPRAGRMRAGQRLTCPPDIGPMQCLMDRIAPAHVEVQYLTTAA